jgi:trehalose utilization protein
MKLALIVLTYAAAAAAAADRLYLLHDTPRPMETLARALRSRGYQALVEDQKTFRTHMPAPPAKAIFMYIHDEIDAEIERALIDWTERGGRLIVLHHGMASAKMRNRLWPKFLGVRILERDHPAHPWKVYRGTFQVVNLRPDHPVTTRNVHWSGKTLYTPSDSPSAEQELPSFDLPDTELFHNQLFTDGRRKTVLLGMKGEVEGRILMQDRAGWMMPAGKGHVFYFQPGHESRDFQHPAFVQIIVNAVEWRP